MARKEILPSFNKALTKAMAKDIKARFKRWHSTNNHKT
jgi:hypothetical protein